MQSHPFPRLKISVAFETMWLMQTTSLKQLDRGGSYECLSSAMGVHLVDTMLHRDAVAMRQFALAAHIADSFSLSRFSDEMLWKQLRLGIAAGQLVVFRESALALTMPSGPTGGPEPEPVKLPLEKLLPEAGKEQKKGPWSLVKLSYVKYLAPGKENPKPKIRWEIKDPSVLVSEGKLEVLRTRDPEDQAPIWTLPLTTAQLRSGQHELEWDGQIDAHADFVDSYVTIEYSPYLIRLTVSGAGKTEVKEETFKVMVAEFELVLGDKTLLGDAKDLALYEVLKKDGGLPGSGGTRKIYLVSNVFKVEPLPALGASGPTGNGEKSNASTTSFDEYKKLWEEGPRIPIDVKVLIKSSTGDKVLAPKAWGTRKVLWDWECVTPNLSALHTEAQTYCNNAQDYKKASSKPSGENAHKDRGGKRTNDGSGVVVSQDSGGSAYPYTVVAGTTRKWAALSGAVESGAKEGLSGAIFRPARMAADGYKLTAYFDPSPKKQLDAEGTVSAAHQKLAGSFEIWREVHFSKHIKKHSSLGSFSLSTMQGYYDPAFIRLADKSGSPGMMTKADYDTAFSSAIAAQQAFIKDHCIDASISQFDGGKHAVTFRDHNGMKASFLADIEAQLRVLNPTASEAAITSAATVELTNALTANGIDTPAKYATLMQYVVPTICQAACGIYMGANDGITIIQFESVHNMSALVTKTLLGEATTLATSSRSKCAIFLWASGGTSTFLMDYTMSHELGHHLFLCHAPNPATPLPPGAEADAHDKADLHCMMGYDDPRLGKLCGKCLLRVRGWDHTKLDKDGTKNKLP